MYAAVYNPITSILNLILPSKKKKKSTLLLQIIQIRSQRYDLFFLLFLFLDLDSKRFNIIYTIQVAFQVLSSASLI